LGSTVWEISPYGGYVWNGNNNGVGSFHNNQIYGVRGGGYVTPDFEIGGNWSYNNRFQPKSENTTAAFAGALGFPQAGVRSNLWEAEFTYNFGRRSVFGSAVRPYLVAGGGGLTTHLTNSGQNANGTNVFVLNNRFINVEGVNPQTLQNAQQNGNLNNLLQTLRNQQNGNLNNSLGSIDTRNGVAFVGNPTGTGTTIVLANTVMTNRTFFTFSYGGGLKTQRVWGPLGFFGDVRGRTIPNLFNGHGTNLLELTAGLNFAWGER